MQAVRAEAVKRGDLEAVRVQFDVECFSRSGAGAGAKVGVAGRHLVPSLHRRLCVVLEDGKVQYGAITLAYRPGTSDAARSCYF